MPPLADAWYSPTSGTFWADVLALGCIVATIIMGRLALPRRRLSFIIVSRSRLVDAPEAMQGDLKVTYQDSTLNNPYVVALEIVNSGRSAIPSASFDNNQCLRLGFATPILKILSIEHEPTSAPSPSVTVHDGDLELSPGLIARREVVRASLLTEGIAEEANVVRNPFNDVKIHTEDREVSEARRRRILVFGTPVIAVMTVIVTVIAAYLSVQSSRKQTITVAADVICLSVIEFGQSSQLAIHLVERDMSVSRLSDGRVHSLRFAPGYGSDLSNASYETQLFVTGSQSLRDSGVQLGAASQISTDDSQATVILKRLPKENVQNASKDLARLSAITNRISNPKSAVPEGCA